MCHRKIMIILLEASSQAQRKLTNENRNVRHSEVDSLCMMSSFYSQRQQFYEIFKTNLNIETEKSEQTVFVRTFLSQYYCLLPYVL